MRKCNVSVPCMRGKLTMKRLLTTAAIVVGALYYFTAPAKADLISQGVVDLQGTGLGAVPTILTLATKNGQDTEESGKVSWNGSADVATADPTGVGGPLAGGAYTIGKSKLDGINNTVTLTDAGWQPKMGLGIIFNPNEPGNSQSITLNKLVLTVYGATTGDVLFSAPYVGAPIAFDATDSGTGKSGFLFTLDQTESDELNAAGVTGADHVGLFAYLTDASGGHETFFGSVFGEVPCDDCIGRAQR